MAMGMISKLFVIFIVINSIVAFAAGSGMFSGEADVKRMSDYIDNLKEQSTESDRDVSGTSGINILEYFNPLNYGPVADFIGIVSGFFVDPILMFGTLPAPFSYMFGTMFSVLEIVAIAGFIRGVAA